MSTIFVPVLRARRWVGSGGSRRNSSAGLSAAYAASPSVLLPLGTVIHCAWRWWPRPETLAGRNSLHNGASWTDWARSGTRRSPDGPGQGIHDRMRQLFWLLLE
jgi:hypothetical protein